MDMLQKFQSTNSVQKARSKQLSFNVNKEGTVRDINGKAYADFFYLGHRVRESSGLAWNNDNIKMVRGQLDMIAMAIRDGSFEFRKAFPESKKVAFLSELERKTLKRSLRPDDLSFQDFAHEWLDRLKATERVTERTQLDYGSNQA